MSASTISVWLVKSASGISVKKTSHHFSKQYAEMDSAAMTARLTIVSAAARKILMINSLLLMPTPPQKDFLL